MKMRNYILCLLVAFLLPSLALAQEKTERTESVKIYFKQGSSVVDQNFMNNGEELARLAALIEAYMQENAMEQGGISIEASASPEGTTQINSKLVNARAEAIANLLGQKVKNEIGYEIDFKGIDWKSLIEQVEANSEVPNRDEVLDILRNTPETIEVDGKRINERNRQLEKLQGGVPYRWLLKNIYHTLRYAAVRADMVFTLELRFSNQDPIEMGAEGGQGEIAFKKSINDNVTPTAKSDAEWISKLKVAAGKATFKAAPNTVAEPRSAKITLEYHGTPYEFVVNQAGATPILSFPEGSLLLIGAEGGKGETAYKTNVPNAEKPAVSCDAEWVKDINVEEGNISYTIEPSTILEPRAAAIKVESYGNTAYIIIRQQKASPAMAVTNADGIRSSIEHRESVMIYFRQGSSVMDPEYMNNGETLKRLAEKLDSYIVADAEVKGRVRINASASPEGTSRINNRLVNARAKVISEWIGKQFHTKIGYEIDTKGIDWALLLALVEDSQNIPHKQEVLDIIKNTPETVTRNGVVVNERERLIEQLHGGESYRWMLKNIYPELRYADVETYIMYACEIIITSENPVNYSAEGGSGVITFKKNIEDKVVPYAHSEANWITGIAATTNDVTYNVEPNPVAEPRFTVISIEAYGTEQDVVINQAAAEPAIAITSENPFKVGAEGGQGVMSYKTNVPNDTTTTPVLTTSADWISDIKEDERGNVTFTVAPNNVAAPRTAVVQVECYGKVQEFVVEQEGAEPVLTITSETPVSVGAEGGSKSVTYTTNIPDAGAATVTTESTWINSIEASEQNVTFNVDPSKESEPRSTSLLLESHGLTTEVIVNQEANACSFPLYMTLSTNALYDLLLTPNIGAEFYLGKGFSVDANWHYAWWSNKNKAYFWRTYGGDLAARWWFGKSAKLKPLTGHHVGLYGQMITYDFEFGKKGVLADRWSWSAGLEYGYSLPITPRMNLDFTLGVGYHWGKFYEYLPIDGHYVWQATKRRQYMGPTKCEVSLVWLIGCNNYNKEKGGVR